MTKLGQLLVAASLFCAQHAQAMFTVRGEIPEAEKTTVLKALFAEKNPTLGGLNSQFPNLRFEFVPDTTWQLLEIVTQQEGDQSWYGLGSILEPHTFHTCAVTHADSLVYTSNSWIDDFFNKNERITALGETSDALMDHARHLWTSATLVTQAIPLPLYDQAVTLEVEAFHENRRLLWGLTQHLDPSVPLASLPRQIEGDPKTYFVPGQYDETNLYGFSFSEREKPAQLILWNGPLDRFKSDSMFDSRSVFAGSYITKVMVNQELGGAPVPGLILYCLSIPQPEIGEMRRFLYLPDAVCPPFMRTGPMGKYQMPRLFSHAKEQPEDPSVHDYKTPVSKGALPVYTETPEDVKALAETWERWQQDHLTIVYTDGKYTEPLVKAAR